MKQKSIVKTYRNGQSVFTLPCIILQNANIVGSEHYVREQRVGFKDDKIIFVGKTEKEAADFYSETTSSTSVAKAKSYLA